jgi:putative tricarboxylic transport membrane protein
MYTDHAEVDESSWRPEGEVEIIAGTPAGGGQDRAVRALASALKETSDLDVGVSNVPGRGGGNAWDVVCSHHGDGHRLSISSPTLITNRLTGVSDLDLDTLTQVALLYSEYAVFAVPAASPLESAEDLIAGFSSSAPQPSVSARAQDLGNTPCRLCDARDL